MANHKSALKAHKQDLVRRTRNRELRTRMRHALKAVRTAIDSGDQSAAQDSFRTTTSLLDTLVTKGVIHANAAARHKSRLHRRIQKAAASA